MFSSSYFILPYQLWVIQTICGLFFYYLKGPPSDIQKCVFVCVCWRMHAKDQRDFMSSWIILKPPTGIPATWLHAPSALHISRGEYVSALSYALLIAWGGSLVNDRMKSSFHD